MTHTVTYIDIDPKSAAAGMQALRTYREKTRALILQETSRPNRFVIVEAFDDDTKFQANETAPHTVELRARLDAIHNSPFDQRLHQTFTVGAANSGNEAGLFYTVTHVDVPPPRREETEVLLKDESTQSRADAGNVRYDVFQQNAPRTNHFSVVAVWEDEAAFIAHQATPHTRAYRRALGPMLGAPYDERWFTILG